MSQAEPGVGEKGFLGQHGWWSQGEAFKAGLTWPLRVPRHMQLLYQPEPSDLESPNFLKGGKFT